jgi:hypothetical protein
VSTFDGTDLLLEEVGRAVVLTIRLNLPQALTDVEDEMAAADAAYYAALNEPVPSTPLPMPVTWMEGHYPDILDRPVEHYPIVTAICFDHRSLGDIGADQWEVVTNGAHVECYLQDPDPDLLNRVSKRYAKALHRVIVSHKDLGGAVQDIFTSPGANISNVAARRISEFTEDYTYVQAVRLEYVFQASPQPW